MSQPVTIALLLLALILPLAGAAALRTTAHRMTARVVYAVAALIFAVALGSALTLGFSSTSTVRLGGLTLLAPASGPAQTAP